MENQHDYQNPGEPGSKKYSSIGHFLLIFSGFIGVFVFLAWLATYLLK